MSRGTTGAQVLARARVHDPLTSVRQAREMNDSGAANTQAGWFLDAVTRWPGRCASELAALSEGRYDRVQANRRLADLEKKGLVTKGESRVSSHTDRMESTWLAAAAHPVQPPPAPVTDERGQVALW